MWLSIKIDHYNNTILNLKEINIDIFKLIYLILNYYKLICRSLKLHVWYWTKEKLSKGNVILTFLFYY